MKIQQIAKIATLLIAMTFNCLVNADIKLESIDPKSIKMESVDLKKNGMAGKQFDISGIKGVIVKIHFREKYLKKKGILDISAEIEEGLAEEEIDQPLIYQNFNIKDEKYIWMLCNNKEERQRVREFLLNKEYTLAIESDNKRFFGKFSSRDEKEKWKEANKKDENSKNKFDL